MKYCDIWNRFPLSCHYARAAVSLIFPVVEAEGSALTFPEFSKAFHSSVARAVFGVSSQTLDAIYMRQIVLATTRNPSLESMQKLTAMAPGKSAAAGKRFSSSAYSILADVSHAEWELAAQASTRESAARLLLNILGNYRKILVSSHETVTRSVDLIEEARNLYALISRHKAYSMHLTQRSGRTCLVRLEHRLSRRLVASNRCIHRGVSSPPTRQQNSRGGLGLLGRGRDSVTRFSVQDGHVWIRVC